MKYFFALGILFFALNGHAWLRGTMRKPISSIDLTPDALNWTDFTVPCYSTGDSNIQTINGIASNINLSIENVNTAGALNAVLKYSLAGGAWTSLTANSTDAINNVASGSTLQFRVETLAVAGLFLTVTIKNASQGNAVLDTFTVSKGGGGCIAPP